MIPRVLLSPSLFFESIEVRWSTASPAVPSWFRGISFWSAYERDLAREMADLLAADIETYGEVEG